jgi:hypothetical protein
MSGVSIDHESSHNASVSSAPDKICGGTKSSSGSAESAAAFRSGNASYTFIAFRRLLGIMPFHINLVCSFCRYMSLPTREFIVEKPDTYFTGNRSYMASAINRLRFLSAKARILYLGGLCGIRGGVAPGQIFLSFGFPPSA